MSEGLFRQKLGKEGVEGRVEARINGLFSKNERPGVSICRVGVEDSSISLAIICEALIGTMILVLLRLLVLQLAPPYSLTLPNVS